MYDVPGPPEQNIALNQGSQVHKSILIKAEYFRKAICGVFRESEAQAIDLPEEDPAIFHFIVAFLYENKYIPIKPAAAVLVPNVKGKGVEDTEDRSDGTDSDSSIELLSDSSAALSRRRRDRRRRHENRHWERMRQKHPGVHRLGCACRQCVVGSGPPCWNCAAPRLPPPPGPPPPLPPPGAVFVPVERPRTRPTRRRTDRRRPSPPPNQPTHNEIPNGDRISGQDLRTWLLTYELNIDVYICANKFLLDDFKAAIARNCIDMLESAGSDAAQAEVLQLCYKLYQGLPESDNLLKMVFARIGFLQPQLFRKLPHETMDFLHTHPEVSALILKEMGSRREEDHGPHNLPAMERPDFAPLLDSYGRPATMTRPPRW
jgi:hypothetical protein